MRVRHRWILLLLILLPAICSADIDKDLQKCRRSHDAVSRATCFKKLIPRIDDLSKQTPGDTNWAEALKEAYEATRETDKVPEAERRIQINATANKLQSSVLAETNSKAQACMAVAQYYGALGPKWSEAAKRSESAANSEASGTTELTPSVKSQVTDAVSAAQKNVRTQSAPVPLILSPAGAELQNNCIKAAGVSDDSNSSGRHEATATVRNTCSQALTVYLCVKSDRAQCWACKTINLKPGQQAQGPVSIGFGDCTSNNCKGVSVVYNATAQGNPPKPNVDDSCQGKTR
jgi:hypothetical protein